MLRSVLRNFTAIGIAHLADRAIVFLFMVYAARVLGPQAFGEYLLIGTYIMFFSITFTAGLLPVAVREIVRHRDNPRPTFEATLSLRLVLGLLAYGLLLLLVVLAQPTTTLLPLAAIAGTALIVDALKDAYTAYHTAFERMAVPSAFQVINSMLTAAVGSTLLYFDHGLLALLLGIALVNVAVNAAWHILFLTRVQRYRLRLVYQAWKDMLLLIAPIAPVQLTAQFNRLVSIMMLSLVGGPMPRERAVGLFGPAQQIASFPLGLLFGLRRAIVPPLAHRLHQRQSIEKEFAAALKLTTVALAFPMLAITTCFSGEILALVFGPAYAESAATLRLVGAAAAIWVVALVPESLIIAHHQHRFGQLLAAVIAPLAINLLLCLLLIPTHGPAGAGAALVVSRMAYLGCVTYYCRVVAPVGKLRPSTFLAPVLVLCAAYAICIYAAWRVESPFMRAGVVLLVVIVAMLAAGHRELRLVRQAVDRRIRNAL